MVALWRPAGLGSKADIRPTFRGGTALDKSVSCHCLASLSASPRARHSTVRSEKPTVSLVGGFIVGASCVWCHFFAQDAPTLKYLSPPSLI